MRSSLLWEVDEKYEETYRFLCTLDRFGILLGLENIRFLLDKIGNPQNSFPSVHVTGSKGKGSTASMVAGILKEAGMKVALYTSPHLNDFRERIRFNGDMVSKQAVIDSVMKIKEVYDPKRTTFFEFTTAVAFDCMQNAAPDIAVVEVGLGGRLDATNTVRSIVTVITDISREHEEYLGEGIESIAREKAGILKPNVPLVNGATRREAVKVITGVAQELDAPLRQFGRDFVGIRSGLHRFTYKSQNMILENVTLAMAGAHQSKNAAIACAIIEELNLQGYTISEESLRNGIQKTRFPGRFELVKTSPDVVIDGAHTPESMRMLKSTLAKFYPGRSPYILMGMLAEKDYREMVRIIAPIASEVVCVPPQGDRRLESEKLAEIVRETGVRATAAETILEGLQIILDKASADDLIVATGSLYLIGPVRRACGLDDR